MRPLYFVDRRRASNWLLVYGSFIVLAEVAFVLFDARIAVGMHAGLLIALAGHNTFARTPKDPQIPVLMLLPMLRLLSLVMPTSDWDRASWYASTGAAVLVAVVLVMRAIGLRLSDVGLSVPTAPVLDGLVLALSLPVGMLLAAVVGDTMRLSGALGTIELLLIAIPFVVVLEELVFRGLLQQMAAIRAPNLAIVMPNVLYAAFYLHSGGVNALVMGCLGLVLSAVVALRGTLWAAIGAHAIFRILIEYV